jgi:heme/copper-type cytochrome/quinol oxidase subunit 2
LIWLAASLFLTAVIFLAYFLITADDRARKDAPIFEINKVTIPIIIVLSVINIIILIRIVTLCMELEFVPKTKFMSYKRNHNLEVVE